MLKYYSKQVLITFPFFFICSMYLLRAQEPLTHEKKVYISPEGKIFINKALPVYLRLSTSPDSLDKSFLLESETSRKYSNPMYFDAEGYNTVRSPWAVDTITKAYATPKQDIVYEVYADSKPPVTRINYSNGNPVNKNNILYFNNEISLLFNADDATSGVENVYYSVNSEPYKIFNAAINLRQEGNYILKYYAVDNVGNAEMPNTVNICIDISAPETKLEITGDQYENIISARSKILLKANDNGIGVDKIFYKLDEGNWKNYQAPLGATLIEQGEHTLQYYCTDLTGNRENEKTFSFYVDKTPPIMVQELIGKSFIAGGREYASGRNQIKITTFDNKAGVKEVFYSINNKDYVKYESPFYLSDVRGTLSLKAYAVDNVGNRTESFEKAETMTVPYIDLAGPSLSYSFNGPVFKMRDTLFVCEKTTVLLKGLDNESGFNRIEYAIDNTSPVVYSNPFSFKTEGNHMVEITGFDNVENISKQEFTVISDNTGPEIFVQFSINPRKIRNAQGENAEVFPRHLIVFLSAKDNIVGVDALYYSINGLPAVKYNSLIGNFNASGLYALKIRAVDKLGNETSKEISFTIEK
jgi:hypothetical protein